MAKANTGNSFILRSQLTSIPDGSYHWTKVDPWWRFFLKEYSYGWLTVETNKEDKKFMWTTHKETHDPHIAKAKNLTINKNTGQLRFYMESVLSFHIKWSIYNQDDKYKDAMLAFANDIEYFMIKQKKGI